METYTQNVNGLENILNLFGDYSEQLKNKKGNGENIMESLNTLSKSMNDFYFDNATELCENYKRVLNNVSNVPDENIQALTLQVIDGMSRRYGGLREHTDLMIKDMNMIVNTYKDSINVINEDELFINDDQVKRLQYIANGFTHYLNSVRTIVSINGFIK